MNYQRNNEELFMKQFCNDLKTLVSSELSLSKMDNEELVKLYQDGNKVALDILIANNTGIIHKLVSKYKVLCSRGVTAADLFQEGMLGLVKASNMYKFDLENKAKFITFAVYYINRYICNCINGRSEKDVENRKFNNCCKSLNVTINGEEGEAEIGNFIKDEDYGFENVIENEFHKQIRSELEEVMNEYLTLREREVIKFIYGWECNIMNGEEVSEVLDVTRERVRQLKENAFRKIRHTSWWMTKGKFYVYEIKGLVYTKKVGRTLSYREVEKDDYSIETIQGHNFINKYFDDLMEVASDKF